MEGKSIVLQLLYLIAGCSWFGYNLKFESPFGNKVFVQTLTPEELQKLAQRSTSNGGCNCVVVTGYYE